MIGTDTPTNRNGCHRGHDDSRPARWPLQIILTCLLIILPGLAPAALADELYFRFVDPVGDNTGPIDATRLSMVFNNVTGRYRIVVQATPANPFLGQFRINVNLLNPGAGSINSFFQDASNDYFLTTGATAIVLSGTNTNLLAWRAGDVVASNTLAGLGNPPGSTFFRTSVASVPFGGVLTNEDAIAYGPEGLTTITPSVSSHRGDFEADGKADVAIFRPSTGEWFVRQSSTLTPLVVIWGGGADKPVPGDYDGDGVMDVAVFRPATGEWFVRQSSTFTLVTLLWGGGTDIAVQADYDGDGITDIAVFRPSTGQWFVRQSSTLSLVTLSLGGGSDIPVQNDFDGDGIADIAVFRPSTGQWFIRQSSTLTVLTLLWGGGADIPVPGDYDGDGATDVAVFRPSTGEWFVRQSRTFTLLTLLWGGDSDIAVPGDFDGDGKTDVAVFRPSTGEWFIRQSRTFTLLMVVWGGGSDIPTLKRP